MKIAVIGAGFAGLGASWHLLEKGHVVTIFDAKGIGAGASGIAAGLLHPYVGVRAKKSWRADAAMTETLKLLKIASQFGPVASFSGILRPAIGEAQITDFQKTAATYSDAEWWDEARVQTIMPLLLPRAALFVRSGVAVDSGAYLTNLWQACKGAGAQLQIQQIEALSQLNEFDHVLISVGASIQKFCSLPGVSIVKGQVLELKKQETLPYAISAGAYVVFSKNSVFAGATFEHEFSDLNPEKELAEKMIRPKLAVFCPKIAKWPLVDCRAAGRVSTGDRMPLIHRVSERVTAITGLGSKGLLYHAYCGKMFSERLSLQSTTGMI
ncbi:MAG TPA: FAD-dependent oxidoreductase [Chlamydiales bacterium]|nr:FAD-dependent oxidoreductase [Chlamydiales bacterium]